MAKRHYPDRMDDHLRTVLVGTAHVEKGQVLLGAGIRSGLAFGALATCFMLLGRPADVVPVALACVFVAFADAGEEVGRRWRTMAWVTLWIMLAAAAGIVLSEYPWIGVLASSVVALACGVAGVAGPRAALGGVLTLVTFIIFLGAPQLPAAALDNALLIGLGGLVITAITVGPHLLRDAGAWRASLAPLPGLWTRIRPRLTLDDPFVRHGVRLAVLIGVATYLSQAWGVEHGFWLPMTIAWVTKPDADGTVSRVAGRLVGTLAGLGVCAVLLLVFHVTGFVAIAICAASIVIIVGFVTANYAVAVLAITVLVVVLFSVEGDPVSSEIDVRLIATFLATFMAIAASFVWRLPSGGSTAA